MATQKEIPGMEHPHGDKQLDDLLAARRKTSKTRKKWQDREIEEGEAIIARMKEKKIASYVSTVHNPPLIVRLKPSEKLKLEVFEEGGEEHDEDGDDVEVAEAGSQKAAKKSAPAEA
jgi:hypothetical protein